MKETFGSPCSLDFSWDPCFVNGCSAFTLLPRFLHCFYITGVQFNPCVDKGKLLNFEWIFCSAYKLKEYSVFASYVLLVLLCFNNHYGLILVEFYCLCCIVIPLLNLFVFRSVPLF